MALGTSEFVHNIQITSLAHVQQYNYHWVSDAPHDSMGKLIT